MVKYLENENDFDKEIANFVLVDFFADWCGPCQMLGPILETINFNILKVNTDEFQDLAQKYGVMSIPTVILFKDGKEVDKFIGLKSKDDIEEFIKNNS